MRSLNSVFTCSDTRKRMLLLCDHIASGNYCRGDILSQREYRELMESFKTPAELELMRRMAKQEERIRYYMPNISIQALNYHAVVNRLRGFCMLFMQYQWDADLFNDILYALDKRPKERQAVKEMMLNHRMFGAEVRESDDGFVEAFTGQREARKKTRMFAAFNGKMGEDKPASVAKDIKLLSQEACVLVARVKTMIQLIRDFMIDIDLPIKTYQDMLNEAEAAIRADDVSMDLTYYTELEDVEFPVYEEASILEGFYSMEFSSLKEACY